MLVVLCTVVFGATVLSFAFFCAGAVKSKKTAWLCASLCACAAVPWFSVAFRLSSLSFFHSAFFACPLCLVPVFFSAGRKEKTGAPSVPGAFHRRDAVRRMCFALCGLSMCVLAFFFPFSKDCSRLKKYSLSDYTHTVISSESLENHSLVYYSQTRLSDWMLHPGKIADDILIAHQMRAFAQVSAGTISAEIQRRSPESRGGSPEWGTARTPAFSIRSLSAAHIIPLVPSPEDFEYSVTRFLDGGGGAVQLLLWGTGMAEAGGGYSLPPAILRAAGYEVIDVSSSSSLDPAVPLVVAGLPSFSTEYADAAASGIDAAETGVRGVEALRDFVGRGGSACFFASPVMPDGSWILRDYRTENALYFDFLNDLGFSISSDVIYNESEGSCKPLRLVSADGLSVTTVNYPFWLSFSPVPHREGGAAGNGAAGGAGTGAIASDGAPHPVFSGVEELCFFWPVVLRRLGNTPLSPSATVTGKTIPRRTLPFDAAPFSAVNADADAPGLQNEVDRHCVFYSYQSGDGDGGDGGGQRIAVFSDGLCVSDFQETAFPNDNAQFLINCVDWLWMRDGVLALRAAK